LLPAKRTANALRPSLRTCNQVLSFIVVLVDDNNHSTACLTCGAVNLVTRPITRPGEVVEAAPGLIAVDHSDGGKANQYYLRGWNLDHGTDFATFVDDVPINLPSSLHGQGYTDLSWLIPETVNGEDIRKRPYFADVGDFANAGNLHISFRA
jgi:TonB-dependent Receptor Plug Domain